MMYRALATLALPAVALAQQGQTLCQTGAAIADCDPSSLSMEVPKHTVRSPVETSTPGITWFKVDVGENPAVGDCPAVCDVDGVVACLPTAALPCPATQINADGTIIPDTPCTCVDGWKMAFEFADNYVGTGAGMGSSGLPALSNAEKSQLTFAISRVYVLFAPAHAAVSFTVFSQVHLQSLTLPGCFLRCSEPTVGSATPVSDLCDTWEAFASGEWEITSKEFNNAHEINVGRKGHSQSEADMVELCRTVWEGNTVASRADAECNCADCGTACGLRGARKSTPCDDFSCDAHFDNGNAVAASRCADAAVVGGSVGHCEDPGDMCNDKFVMQPNCTAYAMSGGLPPAGQAAGYCCGMKPRAFTTAMNVERLYFPTGWAPDNADATGPDQLWTDPYCELDRSSPRYGYETVYQLPPSMEYADCDTTTMGTEAAENFFYLIVVNTHGSNSITLPPITWSKTPLTALQVRDCAHDNGAAAGGAAQVAASAVLMAVAAALVF